MRTQRKRKLRVEKVKVGNVVVRIYHRTREKAGATYPQFDVADFTGGKRRFRSFADHGEAQLEAERIGRALATGQAHAAQLSGKDAASWGRAVELLRPTGMSLELAAAIVAKAVAILGGDRILEAAEFFKRHNPDQLPVKTVAEVVAELLAAKEARGKSARYLGDLRARLGKFSEAFKVNIGSVQTGDIQRWFDGMKASPRTVKNYRTVVGTLFSFAEARGYILKGSNPVEGTERVEANGGSVEILTPDEVAKLIAAADKDFVPCLAIGAFAGLRSAEIERLDWSDVDLTGGHIIVAAAKSKTASRRIVPVADNLKQWLAPYARKAGPIWTGTHDEFYDAQQAAAAAANVEWKANGLRHSFASYRLAEVQSAAQVALEAGNSPAVVFRHYRELVKPSDAVKWFAVSPKTPANVVNISTATG